MVLTRARVATTLGVVLGVALTSTMVVRTTEAAFSGYTQTSANGWTTGGAAITSDYAASAPFTLAGDGVLTGTQQLRKCVVVTYNGVNVPATVQLYGATSGALAPYLTLVIDQGTGTSVAGNCANFSLGTTAYTGTVGDFGTSHTQFSGGVGSWTPSVIGETQTYRFTVTVQSVAAAQNVSATGVFTWEAQV